MNTYDDLQYSFEGAAARVLLYQGLNDINIFVEDADMEYLYETIFRRLLCEKYNISAIFGVGGKQEVKKRFMEFGEKTNNTSNFYIVDGDFDRYIFSDEMINSYCFIYLKTYNIENYFLDEKACVQFVKGRLKKYDKEVAEELNFQYWKNRIVNESSKLFLNYCFIQKYYPQIETISRSSYLFIDKKTGFERTDEKYHKFEDEVADLDTDAEKKIAEIDALYRSINGDNYFNLICGKFLFDSLCCYVRKKVKEKFEKRDFKWHLINHFDINELDYIKNIILSNT